MNPLFKKNIFSAGKQNLVKQYEELRVLVLKKMSPSNNSLGFSILRFRGMATWVEILSSELICSFQEKLPVQAQPTSMSAPFNTQPCLFSPLIHKEATIILTNMIMQQKEIKKGKINYV